MVADSKEANGCPARVDALLFVVFFSAKFMCSTDFYPKNQSHLLKHTAAIPDIADPLLVQGLQIIAP